MKTLAPLSAVPSSPVCQRIDRGVRTHEHEIEPARTSPMQLPTQGQWWSNLRVQLSQMAQGEQRGGR